MNRLARLSRSALPLALLFIVSCLGHGATDLDSLVRRDSTYLAPATLRPFTGKVIRHFPGTLRHVQIEGTLENGVWEGEFTVYHPSGRIRYQGQMSKGAPCGAWLDNRDDEPAGSILDELERDIRSMGVYPPCPDG
jgi:hypothetical protein